MEKIKMICLPFAGGSKYSYYRYVKLAPEWIEVIPVDLPGRGARLNEQLLTDMYDVVEDVFKHIQRHLDGPYVLYGHSMGALTVLLLTRKIRKEGLRMPLHLFVTGHGGPSASDNKIIRYNMPENELIDELSILDGIPGDIMNDRFLLRFFLPVIRADFRAIETFNYTPEEKLDIPITCVVGSEERISLEKAGAWEMETTASVDVRQLPGKHFFIYQHEREIMTLICRKLAAPRERTLQRTLV